MSQEVSKWLVWGYNPFTNHLLTSWDIQVRGLMTIPYYMNIVGADQPDRTYGMLDPRPNGSAWFCCQNPGARNLVI